MRSDSHQVDLSAEIAVRSSSQNCGQIVINFSLRRITVRSFSILPLRRNNGQLVINFYHVPANSGQIVFNFTSPQNYGQIVIIFTSPQNCFIMSLQMTVRSSIAPLRKDYGQIVIKFKPLRRITVRSSSTLPFRRIMVRSSSFFITSPQITVRSSSIWITSPQMTGQTSSSILPLRRTTLRSS